MKIEAGKVYIFSKSGNTVLAIQPTTHYRGIKMWEVERTAGASSGKRMDVPARALVPCQSEDDFTLQAVQSSFEKMPASS